MVRETRLVVDDLIYPLFVKAGKNERVAIPSMPGIYQHSPDTLIPELKEVASLGIPAVLLFGLPEHKDELGSEAYSSEGIVQQTVGTIKQSFPELIVITDICLCAYTSHGHCGILEEGMVANDATLASLQKIAVSHAAAGADMVAPSDMMDGRVGAIRTALDSAGCIHTPIMSYAAKYASHFYGPFREAADCAPQSGDRRSYQMDPANSDEALREIALAAYNVSGEYSLVKAGAKQGMIDERGTAMEILHSIKRAGADLIITYFAKEAAKALQERGNAKTE
jgi:porphobilinogen synthase